MKLLRNLLAIFREIGDQNAYARYLQAHGAVDSGEEWRRFSDERFRTKYQRAGVADTLSLRLLI